MWQKHSGRRLKNLKNLISIKTCTDISKNLLKKETPTQMLSCEFQVIFQNVILHSTYERLLL